MPFRILHVDDDPDVRLIVELSLNLDPGLSVLSCADANEALEKAAEWAPDLILCDVMMPVMDGPALLARLRKNPATANIPLVFMTARAQASEIDRFMLLGAVGVILKPFDPMTLAGSAREHLRFIKLDGARDDLSERLQTDAVTLGRYRDALRSDPRPPVVLAELQCCTHKLAGAAGVYGFQTVSCAASKVEESVIERRNGRGVPGALEADLHALLACIEREESRSLLTANAAGLPRAVDGRSAAMGRS